MERRAETTSALCSPTFPPLRHHAPPYLPLTPHQGNQHARVAPFCVAERRWRIFNLALRKTISPFNHLVITLLLPRREREGGYIPEEEEDEEDEEEDDFESSFRK